MVSELEGVSSWRIITVLLAVIGAVGSFVVFSIYEELGQLHRTVTEVDRTQESVTVRLGVLEVNVGIIRNEQKDFPETLKQSTRDRWFRSDARSSHKSMTKEMDLLHRGIVNRLDRLERYHPPYTGIIHLDVEPQQ